MHETVHSLFLFLFLYINCVFQIWLKLTVKLISNLTVLRFFQAVGKKEKSREWL